MKKTLLFTAIVLMIGFNVMAQLGGSALKFDGVNDYVNTNYSTNLNTFTVECWVKGDAAPFINYVSGVVHRKNNFGLNRDHPYGDERGAVVIHFSGRWYSASFGTLKANVWYHLAATYVSGALIAYTNGKLILSTNTPFQSSTSWKWRVR